MNHIFRSVWSEQTGTYAAVSEIVRSARQSSCSCGATSLRAPYAYRALAVSVMLSVGAGAYAAPAGGVVVAGSAGIVTNGASTTITQSGASLVVNWQSFGIGPGEAVHFAQPGSSSVALNRVLGPDPSGIFGSLSANGKVFLVNPNGILFGRGASVNVGGLVASTLNISDASFMAGRYSFANPGSGSLVNQGTITADGGYVALLGTNVRNEGVIAARLGTVALASGNAVTLDMAGDNLLNVRVDEGALNALVHNGGLVQADGGRVLLTAQAAGRLLNSAVNNSGVIQAQTLENRNGTIRLLGDMQSGTVTVSGTLDVSGRRTGQTGGEVSITGQHVGLVDRAKIDATGDAGGGTVLVGGGFQGGNPKLQNAAATFMSADSSISADALSNGGGGKIVLWANDTTRAYGSLAARGGAQGGDGGSIETSGRWLDVSGISVDASAPRGQGGTWQLDPNDITIQAAGADTSVTASPDFTSTNDSAIVTTGSIETALNAGTSVVVSTGTGGTNAQAGNILVSDTLTYTAVTGPTLTLNAAGNVTVAAPVTATTGSFVANAGGNVVINAATKVTTGNLTFKAAGDVAVNAATTVTTGTVSAIAGGTVNIAAPVTVTTGDVVLRADEDATDPGAAAGGTVNVTCGANCVTITTGALGIRFNPVTYATTGAEIANYGTALTGGGTLDAKAWVFGLGDNKMYDATTAASVSGFKPDSGGGTSGAVLGVVTSSNFDTRHVGTNKLITYDSVFANAVFDLFAASGSPAGTYTARGDILVRPLAVSAATDSRAYDGTTNSAGVPTTAGLQAGDTLNGALAQSYASKDVMGVLGSTLVATGPYTVTDGNGATTTASRSTLRRAP